MNRYRHISPAERAEIWRHVKSRSRIENGVITVHFVKILPPDAPVGAALPEPSPKNPPTTVCVLCGETVPWPGMEHLKACHGISVEQPEPKPFCPTCNREVDLRNLALLDGAYFCRFCTGLVNWPLPEPAPNPPNNKCVVDECTHDAVDGEAFCKEHMLYLGPERPEQWPGGAA